MNKIWPYMVFLGLIFSQALYGKIETSLKIDNGMATIASYHGEILRLDGDWRFSEKHINSIDASVFDGLPLKSAYKASRYFNSYFPGPPNGSFVLKIVAERDLPLSGFAAALTARTEILVLNGSGKQTSFIDPEFGKSSLEHSRREITNIVFPVNLTAGVNYLVLNYEQNSILISGIESVTAGFNGPVSLGDGHELQQGILAERVTLLVPTGIFLCLAIYSLLIYISRRGRDAESLLLFGINFLTFMKEVGSQNLLTHFVPSSAWTQIIGASAMYAPSLATYFGIGVVHLMMPSRLLIILRRILLAIIVCSAIVSASLVLGSDLPDLSGLQLVLLGLATAVFLFVLLPFMIYKAVVSRRPEISILGFGYFALGSGILFDFYKAMIGNDLPWLAMWGGTVLSVVFARNNSKMFALTYERSERLNRDLQIKNTEVRELNAHLEDRVVERTAKINSLLQHIPQGILTIGSGGIVDANYSAQLSEIIGNTEIAGQSFKALILDRSGLSENLRDQAWQSILTIVGEDALNFSLNRDNLPTEFEFHGEKKITLKCTWNFEMDAQNVVKMILVTLLDVSAEVEARHLLDEKSKEFTMVRELIEVGTSKCKQFFSSGRQFLAENENLIESGAIDIESVKILFVNMHTLKGAARTLQFLALAEEFHVVETYYADILRRGVVIGSAKLQGDLHRAKLVFMRYEYVNREVLGRTDDDTKVTIEREFLEQNFQILKLLGMDDGFDQNLRDIIHNNCDHLVKIIFMSLPQVIEDVMKQAARIAKDLEKDEPIVKIDMDEAMISHKMENVLKNAFVHLLRNSLDHGIESSAERVRKGKDPRGSISIKGKVDDHKIFMEVWDDGAGLPIGRLREKGLALELIKPGATVSEIAEIIFNQGMSTANSVSLISGRGIGMGAVRRFIEGEGGQVDIRVDECLDQRLELYRFRLKFVLPILDEKLVLATVA